MINRAQLKWYDYLGQKSDEFHNTPFASASLKSLAKEVIPVCIIAYLFGMASINGLYPFALSFMAANLLYRKEYMLPGIFSFLGTLMAMKSLSSFRYLCAMGIFLLIYNQLNRINWKNEFIFGTAVFVSNMFAGAVFLVSRAVSPYDIFLLILESGMACIMTFMISGGMPWIFNEQVQPIERNICMVILLGVVLSIARNFVFLNMNVRDIIGVFLVLLLALVNGSGAGAAAGIIVGITGFSLSMSPWSTAIMAFSGLVSGAFNKLGKIGVIVGFSLGYLLYNFHVNSIGTLIISPKILAISFVLLLILPQAMIKRVKLYLSNPCNDEQIKAYNFEERARDRLHELASLLNDLGGVFKEIFVKDEEQALPSKYLDSVCRKGQLMICSDCGMRRICWEKELKRTMGAFYTLIKHHEGIYDKKELPFLFKSRCSQTEKIKEIVKESSNLFKITRQMDNIIKYNQELIQEYFARAADVVEAMAAGAWEEDYEINIDDEILERLSGLDISVERIYTDYSNNRLCVNIIKSPCKNTKQCKTLIPTAVSDVLGRKMSTKVIDCPLKSGNSMCRLKVTSNGVLDVCVGVAGVAKEGQNVSGDGFSYLELKEGRYMLALCDGMGVGENAARLSEKTLTLLERLSEAGCAQETVLKVTNSAMIAVNRDESFSTIDMALIDTAGGIAKFIKAGAPAGFIKRGTKIEMIKGGSLPLGIIDEISPKITEKTVRPGDMIVMVTDGVIDAFSNGENGEEMLSRFLLKTKTANPQEMAEKVLKKAKEKNSIRDDMTVLAASVWEKKLS
ncbi:stage II sporulation protein E [Tepidanaerobacter acetatoxydans]|uniref:stage II sporulation protein E n=1 Tax=Tepidanaerobacter acetatoxydans TaxID=499229 RepID=UPI001BD3584C|nr:stage II sporulation protein E [Tepidanaerobacter acetatoxydans]